MGMYTGIRFKGYIKLEYREAMKTISIDGSWGESDIKEFVEFGQIGRSGFIPCGSLSYMPDEWEEDYINESGEKEIDFSIYYKKSDTDGFNRTYNVNNGYWTFQCSLKNYEDEIGTFFELIPLFIEKIEHLEYFYEEMTFSKRYDFVNGKVELVDSEFIKYGLDDDRW